MAQRVVLLESGFTFDLEKALEKYPTLFGELMNVAVPGLFNRNSLGLVNRNRVEDQVSILESPYMKKKETPRYIISISEEEKNFLTMWKQENQQNILKMLPAYNDLVNKITICNTIQGYDRTKPFFEKLCEEFSNGKYKTVEFTPNPPNNNCDWRIQPDAFGNESIHYCTVRFYQSSFY